MRWIKMFYEVNTDHVSRTCARVSSRNIGRRNANFSIAMTTANCCDDGQNFAFQLLLKQLSQRYGRDRSTWNGKQKSLWKS